MLPRPHRSKWLSAVVLSALTALTIPLLSAAPASAADVVPIPKDAQITIDGHGFGHGKGLSQHGARGAARQGLNHREIMDFYYPGTSWGTVRGHVRVHITADTTDSVVVRPRSKLKVRDIAAKKVYTLPSNGAAKWRLTARSKNRTSVAFKAKGQPWKRWKLFKADAQFGAGNRPITLVMPKGREVAYRGVLRSASSGVGKARDTVNVVTMEHYLRGVVPLEMPASWNAEAVRSQAVAARTYATFERSNPLAKHYQICDTTQCQVYGGASAEHPLSDAAIKATAREILTYEGKAAFTQFSSSSGGWTAVGSRPYLVAKPDPYDDWSGNTVHSWKHQTTAAQIEKTWPQLGELQRISVTKRTGHGKWGGRVLNVTLVGDRTKVRITGDEMRFALGLRSNWFNVTAKAPARKGAKR